MASPVAPSTSNKNNGSQAHPSFVLTIGQNLLSSKLAMALKTTKQKQFGMKVQQAMAKSQRPSGFSNQTSYKVAYLYNKKNPSSQSVCESFI